MLDQSLNAGRRRVRRTPIWSLVYGECGRDKCIERKARLRIIETHAKDPHVSAHNSGVHGWITTTGVVGPVSNGFVCHMQMRDFQLWTCFGGERLSIWSSYVCQCRTQISPVNVSEKEVGDVLYSLYSYDILRPATSE